MNKLKTDCTVSSECGVLYVVATPIGNLKDIGARALEILEKVDVIAAEDTRNSKRLLQYYGIATPMMSLHEHNEQQASTRVIGLLQEGRDVALVSDAGTPLISDPGFPLVRECRQQGIRVLPIPGPSALIAALSVSGLPTDRFYFEGFLPRTQQARRKLMERLKNETATLVFYESSHRILHALEDLVAVLGGDRQICIARELSKQFEEILQGRGGDLVKQLSGNANHQKGEFVLMIAGKQQDDADQGVPEEVRELLLMLLEELPVSKAAALTARITGLKKNQLYQEALGLKH